MQIENGPYSLALDKQQYIVMNNQMDDTPSIDLFKLLSDLYKRKWLILATTALSTLLAFGLTRILTPQYQIRTTLTPPTADQFQSIFINTDSKITDTQLFKQFAKTLASKGNYLSFLQASGVVDAALQQAKNPNEYSKQNLLNKLVLNFNVNITNHDKKDARDVYKDNSIEAELFTRSNQLDLTASETKNYLEFTNTKVIAELAKNEKIITQRKITNLQDSLNQAEYSVATAQDNEIKRLTDQQKLKIAELNNQIHALKIHDLREREVQLQELTNALKIAKTLGINKYNEAQEVNNHGLVIDVNHNNTELYLRGSNYLQNQINIIKSQKHTLAYERKISKLEEQLYIAKNDANILALKNRTDNKPYIKNIDKKLTQLKHLKSLSFDLSQTRSYRIDGEPTIQTTPIKPSKNVIIVLGCIIGFMLSSLYVVVRNAFAARSKLS